MDEQQNQVVPDATLGEGRAGTDLRDIAREYCSTHGQLLAISDTLAADPEAGKTMLFDFLEDGYDQATAYDVGRRILTDDERALSVARGYQFVIVMHESQGDPALMQPLRQDPFEWRRERAAAVLAEAQGGGDDA